VRRRYADVGDVAFEPAPQRRVEFERALHQQPRGVEARVVGVDESKMDLPSLRAPAWVMQASF
jgi:hypothetical protein